MSKILHRVLKFSSCLHVIYHITNRLPPRAFGKKKGFSKSSKLRNVSMHFHKTARHWWSSLCGSKKEPKTWEILRNLILKTFLPPGVKNKVVIAWRSLKMTPHESIRKYEERFWAHKLKANVYKSIDLKRKRSNS